MSGKPGYQTAARIFAKMPEARRFADQVRASGERAIPTNVWDLFNNRRAQLIDIEIKGKAKDDELAELQDLQCLADSVLGEMSPLPPDHWTLATPEPTP